MSALVFMPHITPWTKTHVTWMMSCQEEKEQKMMLKASPEDLRLCKQSRRNLKAFPGASHSPYDETTVQALASRMLEGGEAVGPFLEPNYPSGLSKGLFRRSGSNLDQMGTTVVLKRLYPCKSSLLKHHKIPSFLWWPKSPCTAGSPSWPPFSLPVAPERSTVELIVDVNLDQEISGEASIFLLSALMASA